MGKTGFAEELHTGHFSSMRRICLISSSWLLSMFWQSAFSSLP